MAHRRFLLVPPYRKVNNPRCLRLTAAFGSPPRERGKRLPERAGRPTCKRTLAVDRPSLTRRATRLN